MEMVTGCEVYFHESYNAKIVNELSYPLNPFMHNVVKLQCGHRKIFKVWLTILQHYAWKG